MERIWSKVEPGKLLHLVHRKEDFEQERVNLSDSDEPLQLASLCLPGERTFRPHRHLRHVRTIELTQEIWVIIDGVVEVTYYDLDGTELCRRMLHGGDCTLTFRGGHTYTAKSNWLRAYEVKSGPYKGQDADKVFTDGN